MQAMVLLLALGLLACADALVVIVHDRNVPSAVHAAKEIRRYGTVTNAASAFQLVQRAPAESSGVQIELRVVPNPLDSGTHGDSFKLSTVVQSPESSSSPTSSSPPPASVIVIEGSTPQGLLYGAYQFCEDAFGVHFDISGETIPSSPSNANTSYTGSSNLNAWKEAQDRRNRLGHSSSSSSSSSGEWHRPDFRTRGLNPFHDFYEGPDWWSKDSYKAYEERMAKMKMNFIGLHNYNYQNDATNPPPPPPPAVVPGGQQQPVLTPPLPQAERVGIAINEDLAHEEDISSPPSTFIHSLSPLSVVPLVKGVSEPTTWLGPESAVNPDGTVTASYKPSAFQAVTWRNTELGPGLSNGTVMYPFGAAQLYDRNCYGSPLLSGQCPYNYSKDTDAYNAAGVFLRDVFTFGNAVGVSSGVGIEVPALPPKQYPQTLVRLSSFESHRDTLLTQHPYACRFNGECTWMNASTASTYGNKYYHHNIQAWVHSTDEVRSVHPLVEYWNGTNSYVSLTGPPPAQMMTPVPYVPVETCGFAFFANVTQSELPVGVVKSVHLWPLREWHNVVTGDILVSSNILQEQDAKRGNYTSLHSGRSVGWVYKQRPDDWLKDVYKGAFKRILNAQIPISLFWMWTNEIWSARMNGNVRGVGTLNSTSVTSVVQDFLAADAARKELITEGVMQTTTATTSYHQSTAAAVSSGSKQHQSTSASGSSNNFALGTGGWTLGPLVNRSYFDSVLPVSKDDDADWVLTSIDENLGDAGVEQEYKNVTRHRNWVIPWMEDDPGLTVPQLWVNRTLEHLNHASTFPRTSGALGITWRMEACSPTIYALARRGWSSVNLTSHSVWLSWVAGSFGPNCDLEAIANAMAAFEGVRPALTSCPGFFKVTQQNCAWAEALLTPVQTLRAAGLSVVDGPQYSEKFNYWLSQFHYMQLGASLACHTADYYLAADHVRNYTDSKQQQEVAAAFLLPLRVKIVDEARELVNTLLSLVSGPGDMGVISSLMDEFLIPSLQYLPANPSVLNATALAELASWIAPMPVPAAAVPDHSFSGPRRVVVPSARGTLMAGETTLTAFAMVLLNQGDTVSVSLCHSPLVVPHDASASTGTECIDMPPVADKAAHASVFQVSVDVSRYTETDFVYYLKAVVQPAHPAVSHEVTIDKTARHAAEAIELLWPAGAPGLQQSVIML